jgi:purine-nucleoside phosphorylase
MPLFDLLNSLTAQVRTRCKLKPRVAILLGTGLGGVAKRIKAQARIPYGELNGMPMSTAESHKGELVIGTLAGVPVVAFSGRLHCYEGHSAADVVVPVRLAKALGAKVLIMGSAVGGLNPHYEVGDLAVLDDHINLMGVSPLTGPNDDRIGPRWPDMFNTYDRGLLAVADEVALAQKIHLHKAVYAGVLGPNLETRAEYRMLRTLGADVVGMSTVPEAIAAVHCGLKTLAFAIITDRCIADALEPADVKKIIAAANGAEPVLTGLITAILPKI